MIAPLLAIHDITPLAVDTLAAGDLNAGSQHAVHRRADMVGAAALERHAQLGALLADETVLVPLAENRARIPDRIILAGLVPHFGAEEEDLIFVNL